MVRTRKGPQAVPELPGGAAWLFVEVSGDDALEVADRAARVSRVGAARHSRVITDGRQAAALWRIRADGGGLAGRSPAGAPAHAGWEDAAVPPETLGDYLRDFDELLLAHRLTGFPFGHFGDGCVHVRLDFPFQRADGTAAFRAFLTDAAKLVARYGGSLSGEHGDGRARSELLPTMYTPAAISLFGKVKGILDPDNHLNPGVLVEPEPLDANVRVAEAGPLRSGLGFGYLHDDGDFSQAVHRCTGVGQCRAAHSDNQTVMCPSYLATLEEKDSTRGSARALQEMINGSVTGGAKGVNGAKPNWRAPEVHAALDLCLSCKGCASDCPTGTDLAAYKAEVLHQSYQGRLRPASHYSLGWLPRWARFAAFAPRMVNFLMRLPGLGQLGLRMAGVDQRRSMPAFASQTFQAWFTARTAPVETSTSRPPVLLWADSFTNNFSPEVGKAAVRVLESAGYEVRIPEKPVCCALTWISTGQLDSARKILRSSIEVLGKSVEQGIPIVGLEPSCTGVLRSDAVILADGYSCRTQLEDLSERKGIHLAQLLDPARRTASEEPRARLRTNASRGVSSKPRWAGPCRSGPAQP